ncbi:MAG: hypothetical protein U0800_15210 [Isosphaeraceae bacterium]
MFLPTLALLAALPADAARFESAKYGVAFDLPDDWAIALRERDEYVVVARIPQADPDLPGAFACELGPAPEGLDEYRTRLEANAARGRTPGRLVRNEVVKAPGGDRLVTVREFQPPGQGTWHEIAVRVIAHRQLYTFTLNVDDATHHRLRPAFGALIDSARFTPPDTGLIPDPTDRERPVPRNRWIHRADRFAVDLPERWSPTLAPAGVARLFASSPPRGIWSDNLLVLAEPRKGRDLEALSRQLPDDLRREDPSCEVVSCKVIRQGDAPALETIVKARRGPFAMTVLERRFSTERLDYEVKFTVESRRFDELLPQLRKTLDSFVELPAEVDEAAAGASPG